MRVITISTQKEITHCYHTCPYFGVEQGGVMTCSHPKAPNLGYIITRENSIDQFPNECPLLKK